MTTNAVNHGTGVPESGLSTGGSQHVSDAVYLEGRAQATLSVSAVAAQTTDPLAAGIYDVWCDVDVYIKTAATANDVTTDTGYFIKAGNVVSVVFSGRARLGAIAGGSGTLRYHQIR